MNHPLNTNTFLLGFKFAHFVMKDAVCSLYFLQLVTSITFSMEWFNMRHSGHTILAIMMGHSTEGKVHMEKMQRAVCRRIRTLGYPDYRTRNMTS